MNKKKNNVWPSRTFKNWVLWNLRGRPKIVVTKHACGTLRQRDAEEIIFIADYLYEDWWKLNDGWLKTRYGADSQKGVRPV